MKVYLINHYKSHEFATFSSFREREKININAHETLINNTENNNLLLQRKSYPLSSNWSFDISSVLNFLYHLQLKVKTTTMICSAN